MKCDGCNKKLSKLKRILMDKLGFTVYQLGVVDKNGNIKTLKPLCNECGYQYAQIEKLVEKYGEKFVLDMMKKIIDKE